MNNSVQIDNLYFKCSNNYETPHSLDQPPPNLRIQMNIRQIMRLELESERGTNIDKCIQLIKSDPAGFSEMMDIYFRHHLAKWMRDPNQLDCLVLELGAQEPELFLDCLRGIIVSLKQNDRVMLREIGIEEAEVPHMLKWLTKRHPTLVREVDALVAEEVARSQSSKVKEGYKKLQKRLTRLRKK